MPRQREQLRAAARPPRPPRRGLIERLILRVAWPAALFHVASHPGGFGGYDGRGGGDPRGAATAGPASSPPRGEGPPPATPRPPRQWRPPPRVFAEGANWAQVVGEQRQNTVSPARAGFSPRWGHASVHLDASIGTEVVESLVVLGGESVESLPQNRKVVSHEIVGVHHDGSRGFRNDVHSSNAFR